MSRYIRHKFYERMTGQADPQLESHRKYGDTCNPSHQGQQVTSSEKIGDASGEFYKGCHPQTTDKGLQFLEKSKMKNLIRKQKDTPWLSRKEVTKS